MPNIRSTAENAAKWKRRTENAGAEYEQGVNNPKKDWAAETAKAEGNYEKGVQAAITKKRFGKGVVKAGNAKWKNGAVQKGVQRFGPGVQASGDNYAKGFSPYAEVIKNTTLPPRYPKGDPRNFDRVKAMGTALHNKKVQG